MARLIFGIGKNMDANFCNHLFIPDAYRSYTQYTTSKSHFILTDCDGGGSLPIHTLMEIM